MVCFDRILKSTGYTVTADAFTITTETEVVLKNRMLFKLILCRTLPSMSTIVPVEISVGGTSYPLLDKFGNRVMSDEIRARHCYYVVYGNNPEHFLGTNICTVTRNYEPAPAASAAAAKVNAQPRNALKKNSEAAVNNGASQR